jgi:creatinine amidohydrolase
VTCYGVSLGHTDRWPGTLSLTPVTMIGMVVEIGRWVHASGFRKLLLVNGHGPNQPPCQSAILQLRHDLPDMRLGFLSLSSITEEIAARYGADGVVDYHANEAETSMVLALEPDWVRPDRYVDEPDRTIGRVLQYAMPPVTRSGVVGCPTQASPERGAALFADLVDALEGVLRAARAEQDPELPA